MFVGMSFHNITSQGQNFIELLAEARKYRMSLILSTQFAAQLQESGLKNDILSAVKGNVGSLILFRLGQDDAMSLGSVLHPYFNQMDIIGLPNWEGYARFQIAGDSIPPFSFRSIKDQTPYNKSIANQICKYSRKKYGTDVNVIYGQIEKRRTIWHKELAELQS